MIILSVWLLTDPTFYVRMAQDESSYYTGIYIFLAVGLLMFVVGFLGCCGAYRESPCLLVSVRIVSQESPCVLLFVGIVYQESSHVLLSVAIAYQQLSCVLMSVAIAYWVSSCMLVPVCGVS